jgi:hypothetical protein
VDAKAPRQHQQAALSLVLARAELALRKAKSLNEAFVVARTLVRNHELREHFEPSNPLIAGGANVQPFLIAHTLE